MKEKIKDFAEIASFITAVVLVVALMFGAAFAVVSSDHNSELSIMTEEEAEGNKEIFEEMSEDFQKAYMNQFMYKNFFKK